MSAAALNTGGASGWTSCVSYASASIWSTFMLQNLKSMSWNAICFVLLSVTRANSKSPMVNMTCTAAIR